MADPYQKVKGGRLTFKGGAIATLSKSIDKKKTKKKTKNKDNPKYSLDGTSEFPPPPEEEEASGGGGEGSGAAGGEIYTIDAAKRMNYEELFPVETKKRGYDPKSSNVRSAEDALDDRVKKKADRYCMHTVKCEGQACRDFSASAFALCAPPQCFQGFCLDPHIEKYDLCNAAKLLL